MLHEDYVSEESEKVCDAHVEKPSLTVPLRVLENAIPADPGVRMEQTRRGIGSQTQQGLVAIGRRLSDPGFIITFLAMEARLVGHLHSWHHPCCGIPSYFIVMSIIVLSYLTMSSRILFQATLYYVLTC